MANSFAIGQRVRIASHVTRNAWGAPISWAGCEATVISGGGLVQGVRVYSVRPDGVEFASDFADFVLISADQGALFAND